MITNTIDKVMEDISLDDYCNIAKILANNVVNVGNCYSYIVYANIKDNVLTGWTIQYNVSQVDDYNLLSADDVAFEILKIIKNDYREAKKKYVIGYNQPPLELILQLFDPLVKKMALIQQERWKQLEYDDLCQDCRLVISILYYKGYYIHKRLVEKSFNNYVLNKIRHDRGLDNIASLDEITNMDSDDKSIPLYDTLPDTSLMEQQQDEELEDMKASLYNELKEVIIEAVGQRQYDDLLRAYGTNTTDGYHQAIVHKLKTKLKTNGTLDYLIRKYN